MTGSDVSNKLLEAINGEMSLASSLPEYRQFGYRSEWEMLSRFCEFISDKERNRTPFFPPTPIHITLTGVHLVGVDKLFLSWCEYRWFNMSEDNLISGRLPRHLFASEITESRRFFLYKNGVDS
jgi:hypothetical protein